MISDPREELNTGRNTYSGQFCRDLQYSEDLYTDYLIR